MTALFHRISEQKRNRILQAAIHEFATYGYDLANTNNIAKRANISVGSLFQYFENKEDLFLTTVTSGAAAIKSALEDILSTEEDIFIKVDKILRLIQTHSRNHIDMIRLYNEMSTRSNSRIMLKTVESLESISALLYSSLIEKAQKNGEIRMDCDPKMFAFLLDNLFMMLQFSYSCDYYRKRFKIYVTEDIFEMDDFVVEQVLAFIKSALRKE